MAFVSRVEKPRHRQDHPDGEAWSRQPHASADGIQYLINLNPVCSRQRVKDWHSNKTRTQSTQPTQRRTPVNAPNPDLNPNQRLRLLYLLYSFYLVSSFNSGIYCGDQRKNFVTGKHVPCCMYKKHFESRITRL